jgi:hypothetical protein
MWAHSPFTLTSCNNIRAPLSLSVFLSIALLLILPTVALIAVKELILEKKLWLLNY